MIKMMLQEVLKGFESRLGERVWGKGEVKHIFKVISYQHTYSKSPEMQLWETCKRVSLGMKIWRL